MPVLNVTTKTRRTQIQRIEPLFSLEVLDTSDTSWCCHSDHWGDTEHKEIRQGSEPYCSPILWSKFGSLLRDLQHTLIKIFSIDLLCTFVWYAIVFVRPSVSSQIWSYQSNWKMPSQWTLFIANQSKRSRRLINMKTGPFYRVNHFIIFSLHFSLNYLVSILFSESWCGTMNWTGIEDQKILKILRATFKLCLFT